jgi:predicted enzyme related to lactoylglutathione lyase
LEASSVTPHQEAAAVQHTIVHFEIPADQPERAAQFYRELFGWDIQQFEGSVAGGMEYWTVRTVPAEAQGGPATPGVNGGMMRRMYPGQGPINYINVEHLDESVRLAQRLGAEVLMGRTPVPGMGWFAQLKDTEGNLFAVWERDLSADLSGAGAAGESGNAGR